MNRSGCRLNRLKVLVTRPEHQATPLIAALRDAGAEPVAFPTIEITPNPNAGDMLDSASGFDDVIYISANAVRISLPYFRPQHQRVIAIGKATADALLEEKIRADITPARNSDSESLLEHPQLVDMQGRSVLIIRGDAGRELLAETLNQRGALVEYADVYHRRCPQQECNKLTDAWTTSVDVITATSNAIIDNLLRLCGNGPEILETPIVVASERIAKHAETLGFSNIQQSGGASAESIVSALCESFSTSDNL